MTLIDKDLLNDYDKEEGKEESKRDDALVVSSNQQNLYFIEGFKTKDSTTTKTKKLDFGRIRSIDFLKCETKLEKKDETEEGTDLSTDAIFVALSTEGKFAHWAIEDFLD